MLRPSALAAAVFTSAALLLSPPLSAQHAGDVQITLHAGKITIGGNAETQFGTGYKIFEGNFGDLFGGPHKTDDPGFEMEDGTFLAGQQLWYQASSVLKFWNGSAWGAPASGKTFTIEDAFGGQTFINGTGVTNPLGVLDAADAGGGIHTHIDFLISNAGPVPTPAGAYMVTLALTSRGVDGMSATGYLDSDPFLLVMNHGLSAASFESAVHALAVPEPEAYAMLLAGLALVGAAARRRREGA